MDPREFYFKKQSDDHSHFKLIIKSECNWPDPLHGKCVSSGQHESGTSMAKERPPSYSWG